MKKLIVVLSLLLLSISLFAVEMLDVVYCKNGDVVKGVIVENVPNDYVIVQAGESRITLSYDQIAKFTREEPIISPDNQVYLYRVGAPTPHRYYVKIAAGYFTPNSDLSDVYDPFVVPQVGFGYKWNKNISSELAFEVYTQNKKIPDFDIYPFSFRDIESNFVIIPITATAFYNFKKTDSAKVYPYAGIGTGYYILQEYLSLDTYYQGEHQSDGGAKTDRSGLGWHFVAGCQLNKFYIDIKYATANLTDPEGDINAGGTTLSGGFRFGF